jgi:DNA replication and repair protein RecF
LSFYFLSPRPFVTHVRITELHVGGFRNLRGVRIVPDARANVLLGANGQGKTSVLEAIDYAASLRSFRGASRAQLVHHEGDAAQILLRVEGGAFSHEYRVKITRTTRDITLDGKRPERAVEYFGGAACVVFQPGDLELVQGSPDARRRLLDRVLQRVVEGYGEALKSYGKALRSRNALLREHSPDLRAVQAYDFPLARFGSSVIRAREAVVGELVKAAQKALGNLASEPDNIGISYRTRTPGDQVAYTSALTSNLRNDLQRRTTIMGPHADDLALTWSGKPARIVASQGQTRALALALRLAELSVIESRTKVTPALLLDDVSSELDQERIQQLFALVSKMGAQVWVSTTDPNIAALLPNARRFEVADGKVSLATS